MRLIDNIKQLNDTFGDDWITAEPETLCIMLDLDPEQEDVIEAIRCLVGSDLPWIDPFVFENCVDGVCGNQVLSDVITLPELEEIAVSVKLMSTIRPDMEFSADVLKYIACVAMDAGFVWLPYPLDIANEYMRESESSLQSQVKGEIEKNGDPVYDHPYLDDQLGVALLKYASLSKAISELFDDLF